MRVDTDTQMRRIEAMAYMLDMLRSENLVTLLTPLHDLLQWARELVR